MKENSSYRSKYWLHDSSKQAISYLEEFHDKWTIWNNSPFQQAWLRNIIAYYSPVIHPGSWDTSLIFEGVQGEITRFYTPKARTLTRQLVALITKQALNFECVARMSASSDVVQDLKLGNALAESLIEMERLDNKDDILVEGSLVCGSWFTKTTWRTDKGRPYTSNNDGTIVYTGGVDISLSSIFDTFYDITIQNWQDLSWVECRTIKNRWDLIAQHPDLADKILAVGSVREFAGPNTWFNRSLSDNDLIYVYEFFAKPSPSLPEGRMICYAGDACVFYDDVNPYGEIPVEPMQPEQVLNTGLGYPQFTNIIACQEMFDNSLSAIATNQSQFAVQSVAIPRGGDINPIEINGMRFVNYTPQPIPGGGAPTPLQLTQSSPETFKFAEMLGAEMQEMSYLNGALVGKPPAGVTSGVAIATLSANAIEFVNGIAKARVTCWKNTMLHALKAYMVFGKLDQNIKLKGKNGQQVDRTFTGDNLKAISEVTMAMANPLMLTTSGRLEIAQQLSQIPKDQWPEYVSILEGRPLSSLYKGDLSELDLINSENDALQAGKDVITLITDDHPKHIMYHAGLLNDPDTRFNSKNIQKILNHIEEHKNQAQNADPFLMAMVRTGKMPMAPPPGQAGPQPNGQAMGPPPGQAPASQILPHQAQPLPPEMGKDLLGRMGPPRPM